jgi:Uma2 family endonuclease
MQPEFHRRYEQYPPKVKFELIGGIVYRAGPVITEHGRLHAELGGTLGLYKAGTPGTEGLNNVTTILGEQSEPQPDLTLRILPSHGGRSWDAGPYIGGPAELLVEVAVSSRHIDLGAKRVDYEQAGVLEYLVAVVEDQEAHWFDFRTKDMIRARKGIYKSRVFPGLWLDAAALFASDTARLIAVVQEGLASKPHAAFVRRLEAARRRNEAT